MSDHDQPRLEAVIFDTDGVVTRTAMIHFSAWKRLFDDELRRRAGGEDFDPFTHADYRRYVDGKPREDGVACFLAARGIDLPMGDPDDAAGHGTVHALGRLKNGYFLDHLRAHGVEAFATTVAFATAARRAGLRTAVISASRNCAEVLAAAGVSELFDERVDGVDAAAAGWAGKPDPAIFTEAARRLGVAADRTAVVEDATAGVQAARRGGFTPVIGIDRVGHPEALADYADLVVSDLADLAIDHRRIVRVDRPEIPLAQLPHALVDPRPAGPVRLEDDLAVVLRGRRPAVFLDYDGTLTPIVARPELAQLDPATRQVLRALAARTTVAIISGRDLDDVRNLVGGDHRLWFAGSHGFDIASPDGDRHDIAVARDTTAALDTAERRLADRLASIPQAWAERKRFALAVHYRQTPDAYRAPLEAMVAEVADDIDGLRMSGGKAIFELRPDLDWDKGKALGHIMAEAHIDPTTSVAVFVGDDVTDEDAFAAVRTTGIGIIVGQPDRLTTARYRLDDPGQVRLWLARLVDQLDETGDRP